MLKKVEKLLKQPLLIKEISKKLNISGYKLKRYYLIPLNVVGYQRKIFRDTTRKRQIKYPNFFEKVDSELKAYILGLLASDGNIHNNFVSIKSKDIELIEICNNLFNRKIHRVDNLFRMRIGSINTVNGLKQLGLRENKSYRKGLDSLFLNIPNILKCHFIRGFLDGDGCVSKNRYTFIIFNTDGKLLRAIAHFLKINKYRFEKEKKKNCILYKLVIDTKKEFFQCFHKLYDNSTYYLNRKRENFVNKLKYEFQHGLIGLKKSSEHRRHISESRIKLSKTKRMKENNDY